MPLPSRKTLTLNRHPQAGARPVGPGEGLIVVCSADFLAYLPLSGRAGRGGITLQQTGIPAVFVRIPYLDCSGRGQDGADLLRWTMFAFRESFVGYDSAG